MKKHYFQSALCRKAFLSLFALLGLAAAAQAAELTAYPKFNELSFTYDGRPFSADTFACKVTPGGGDGEFTQMNVAYLSLDGGWSKISSRSERR